MEMNANKRQLTIKEVIGGMGTVGTVNIDLESVEDIVNHPISCGYLQAFCDTQYSVENVNFLIEVGKFVDLFNADLNAWRLHYQEIDAEVNLTGLPSVDDVSAKLTEHFESSIWPSAYVNQLEVSNRTRWLWESFLSHEATTQICVPSVIYENTKKRVTLLHIYGPRVFDQALLDPIKTIKRDIYPRFNTSDYFAEMVTRMEMLDPALHAAATLEVPFPDEAFIIQSWGEAPDFEAIAKKLEVYDILQDKYLYEKMLTHLRAKVSSENLLCIRSIDVFKTLMPGASLRIVGATPVKQNDVLRLKAIDQGWKIYHYFVAAGAPFEVSLSAKRRKDVQLSLANPKKSSFDRVGRSAMTALKVHFAEYQKSSDYASDIRAAYEAFSAVRITDVQNSSSSSFCLWGMKSSASAVTI